MPGRIGGCGVEVGSGVDVDVGSAVGVEVGSAVGAEVGSSVTIGWGVDVTTGSPPGAAIGAGGTVGDPHALMIRALSATKKTTRKRRSRYRDWLTHDMQNKRLPPVIPQAAIAENAVRRLATQNQYNHPNRGIVTIRVARDNMLAIVNTR